jgi:23S rRNA pseudouridine2605 synthase
MNKGQEVRLQLFMARSGVASRRASERLIAGGSVTVNGELVTEMGYKVIPTDDVRVDGRRIHPEETSIYIALNKPKKYLCTAHDPEGRPLAIDLIREDFSERLFSVGRLDFMSSGLIFYTNDGEFARAISHPSTEIEKEYRVDTQQEIPEELLQQYESGIVIDGETLRIRSYRYKTPRSVRLILTQGRNREIRRVFGSWKITVKRIHRTRIGSVALKNLPSGQYRPLTQKEIGLFLKNGPRGDSERRAGS